MTAPFRDDEQAIRDHAAEVEQAAKQERRDFRESRWAVAIILLFVLVGVGAWIVGLLTETLSWPHK
jgi:uncharacterized membrane protein YcjF (UPF0283 family)